VAAEILAQRFADVAGGAVEVERVGGAECLGRLEVLDEPALDDVELLG
jgi:hypothetical protein